MRLVVCWLRGQPGVKTNPAGTKKKKGKVWANEYPAPAKFTAAQAEGQDIKDEE